MITEIVQRRLEQKWRCRIGRVTAKPAWQASPPFMFFYAPQYFETFWGDWVSEQVQTASAYQFVRLI